MSDKPLTTIAMLDRLKNLREFISKANTVQRMASADKIALSALDGLIDALAQIEALKLRVIELEAAHAKSE